MNYNTLFDEHGWRGMRKVAISYWVNDRNLGMKAYPEKFSIGKLMSAIEDEIASLCDAKRILEECLKRGGN